MYIHSLFSVTSEAKNLPTDTPQESIAPQTHERTEKFKIDSMFVNFSIADFPSNFRPESEIEFRRLVYLRRLYIENESIKNIMQI